MPVTGGGETQKDPSGWTVDTLSAHTQSQFDAMRRLLDERYATQTKAIEAAFAAAEKAVAAALLAAEKAVNKAETAANERFESVNEFRAQLADQATTFMPRVEAEQRMTFNTEKIAGLEERHNRDIEAINIRHAQVIGGINSRLDLTAGRGIGIEKGWSLLIGLAGLVGGVIAIIVTFIR